MDKEITLDEYVLTNLDLRHRCFAIRLKDNKEYIVYNRKEKSKRIYYIEKDNKEIPLNEEVKKCYLSEVRLYNRVGI